MHIEIHENIDIKSLAVTFGFEPEAVQLINALAVQIKLKGTSLNQQNRFRNAAKQNGLTVKQSKGLMTVFKK
jgi:hypothetical protein